MHVEGVLWSDVIEAVCEGVDEGLELVEAVGQVVAFLELISSCALVAFDDTVDLRPFGREHVER